MVIVPNEIAGLESPSTDTRLSATEDQLEKTIGDLIEGQLFFNDDLILVLDDLSRRIAVLEKYFAISTKDKEPRTEAERSSNPPDDIL